MSVRLSTVAQTAPITSLAVLPVTPPLLLAGTASSLLALRLGSKARTPQRFGLLERDRIHAVVVRPTDEAEPRRWRVLVLGGREAAMAEVSLAGDESISIKRLWFANMPDWVHSAAFISNSQLAFITAHNSIIHYSLSATPSIPPTLVHTYHCPLQPLLWTAAFSRAEYATLTDVRAGAGSMIGDAIYWSLAETEPKPNAKDTVVPSSSVVSLRGHYNDPSTDYRNFQGGVFCLAFSADGSRIATGSDDRTIRVWDLPPGPGAGEDGAAEGVAKGSTASAEATGQVIGPSRTLWGHEGRVWRINWLNDERLGSVAEDTTCRIWSLAPRDEAAPILKTFKDGHDGRSIWSLVSYQMDDVEGGVYDVCMTGGADGAIRTWSVAREKRETVVPKEGEFLALHLDAPIRSFHAAELAGEGQIGLAVTSKGCLYSSPLPPSPSNPPTLLHQAAGLRAPCLLDLSADRILSFSNLGLLVSIDRATGQVRSCDTGVAAVEIALTHRRHRVALFERRGSRVVVLDLAGFFGGDERSSVVAEIALDRKALVRSLAFSPSAEILALGTHKGAILVYALDGSPSLQPVFVHERAHAGMVNQLVFETARAGGLRLELQSVSKDGTRGRHLVEKREGGEWAMRRLSSDALSRGELSQILPPAVAGGEGRYVALVELTALVVDASGNTLSTFISPGRYDPTIVSSPRGIDLYRMIGGNVHRQFAPSLPASLPPGTLLPRFHGREVRCVALATFEVPATSRRVELMFTGAENAVACLSRVAEDGAVAMLWEDPQPVAAVKAVAVARSVGGGATLFAAGVREHLRAWKVVLNEADETGDVRARVQAAGAAGTVTDSGGEVRVMDMAVVPLDAEVGTHLGVTCLSDGWVWVWVYDERAEAFRHVGGTGWHAKCVLSLASVEAEGRLLILSGASDGMLAVWDLTALREMLRSDAGAVVKGGLGEPVLHHRAHLSGVNGLDVVYDAPTSSLLVATAGDDNALTLARLAVANLSAPPTEPLSLTLTPLGALLDAHSSTIQGLRLLSPTLLLSNSVDQRLSVHTLATGEGEGPAGPLFRLVGAKEVAVADCSGMGCLEREEGRWRVAVVGIGAELVDLEVGK